MVNFSSNVGSIVQNTWSTFRPRPVVKFFFRPTSIQNLLVNQHSLKILPVSDEKQTKKRAIFRPTSVVFLRFSANCVRPRPVVFRSHFLPNVDISTFTKTFCWSILKIVWSISRPRPLQSIFLRSGSNRWGCKAEGWSIFGQFFSKREGFLQFLTVYTSP